MAWRAPSRERLTKLSKDTMKSLTSCERVVLWPTFHARARRRPTRMRPRAAGRWGWRAPSREQPTRPPRARSSSSGRTRHPAPCSARIRTCWAMRAPWPASLRLGRQGPSERAAGADLGLAVGFCAWAALGQLSRRPASRRQGLVTAGLFCAQNTGKDLRLNGKGYSEQCCSAMKGVVCRCQLLMKYCALPCTQADDYACSCACGACQ